MKRILSILTVGLLTFYMLNAQANEGVLLEDDFEKLSVGATLPGGWIAANDENSSITIEEDPEKGNVARIYDRSTTAACSLTRKFTPQKDVVAWSFDFKENNGNANTNFFLGHNGTAAVKLDIFRSATENGRGNTKIHYLVADRTGRNVPIPIISIGSDWYSVTIVANIKQFTFSMYFNGEQVVTDAPFYSKVFYLNEIGFSTSSWGAPIVLVDNIRVSSGVPDEAALGLRSSIKSTGVDYGDYLIKEVGARIVGENLDDWNSNRVQNGRIEVAEDGGSKYFSLKAEKDTAQRYIYKAFEPQHDKISLSLRFKEDKAGYGSQFMLREGKIPLIELKTDKKDGTAWLMEFTSAGDSIPFGKIKSGVWQELLVNVDIKKCTFDVFLDGAAIAEGRHFKRKASSIDNVAFFSGGYNGGSIEIHSDYEFAIKDITVTEKDVREVKGDPMPDPPVIEAPPQLAWGDVTVRNFKSTRFNIPDLSTLNDGVKDLVYAGIHWVRIGFSGNDAYFDTVLNALYNAGIKAYVQIVKTNPANMLGTPEQEEQNARLLKELVMRYKDKVKYWELHNEPNLGDFWRAVTVENGGSGDKVKDYVKWLEYSYQAIKSADPEAVVILGGLSEWKAEDYIDRLGAEKAYLYFDEFAFHPYEMTPDGVVERLRSCKERIALWPEPYNSFPIWMTEVGFHANPNFWTPGAVVDETVKAQYLVGAFEKLVDEMGKDLRPISWYTFNEPAYGLLTYRNIDGVWTAERFPALEAMRSIDDVTPREIKETPPPSKEEKNQGEETQPAKKIFVTFNGEPLELDVNPYMNNDIVFVPMRAIFEKAGADVSWDGDTRTAFAEKEKKSVSCTVGSFFARIGEIFVKLDAAPELRDGALMTPLRYVAEGLDLDVSYNESDRTVKIMPKIQ